MTTEERQAASATSPKAGREDARPEQPTQPEIVRRLHGLRRARQLGVVVRPVPLRRTAQAEAFASILEVDGWAQYGMVDDGGGERLTFEPLVEEPVGMAEISRRLASVEVLAEAALSTLKVLAFVASGLDCPDPGRVDHAQALAAGERLERLMADGLVHDERSLAVLARLLDSTQRQRDQLRLHAHNKLLFVITSLEPDRVRMVTRGQAKRMLAGVASGQIKDVIVINDLLD